MSLRSLVLSLLAVLLLASASFASQPAATPGGMAQAPAFLTRAPLNPEFLDYPDNLMIGKATLQTAQGYGLGYVPPPLDLSHLRGQRLLDVHAAFSPPETYDLRTLGKLTPVKNQNPCGSCWAFAAYGSMESCLLPGETWDFSENNMKNTHGFDRGHCEGGNEMIATAYLARWSGAIDEADDPYDPDSNISPPDLPVQKHVQEVIFVPGRGGPLDNDTIKQAVMNYGAVDTAMCWDDVYYNPATYAYYCSGTQPLNHMVCIVGWDDNFDKNQFPTIPPGNGAFIIRNSWGTGWGQGGYFYISYYDPQVGLSNALFRNAEPPLPETTCHQYDPLGWISTVGYGSDTAWFANIFSVPSDEVLTSVAFYAASVNSTYDLYIYLDPTSDPVTGGTLVASKFGAIAEPGYHTIHLDTEIPIGAGHTFSAVVTLTTPGYNWPIPTEIPLPDYSSGATANPGESFISPDGIAWQDLTTFTANANACLKAFAVPPDLQALLEVHPNERGQGPPTTTLKTGGPFWTWPTPSGSGGYTWKIYRFGGSGSLWIQVCAQNYAAFQNKPNTGFGNGDTLMLVVDGVVTPSDVWGIQSGPAGGYQWKGDVDMGKRLELEFCVTGLTPGPHTLRLTASMCPAIYWIKVYDLEPRSVE